MERIEPTAIRTDDNQEESGGLLNRHVIMSNDLARASHGLALSEKRLIVAALAQIDQRKLSVLDFREEENRTYTITRDDYQALAELSDPDGAYVEMLRAVERLTYRVIKIRRRDLETGKYRRHLINWVEEATYIEGQGEVKIVFTSRVMPHLARLRGRFTQYQLNRVSAIRSVYAWRMIEFLESWSSGKISQGSTTMSVDRLREMLEVPESYRWVNIRQRVLQPTIRELKRRGIELTITPIKTGKRITSIRLDWGEIAQGDLFQHPA